MAATQSLMDRALAEAPIINDLISKVEEDTQHATSQIGALGDELRKYLIAKE